MKFLLYVLILCSFSALAAPRMKTGEEFFIGLRTSTNQIPNQATAGFFQGNKSSLPLRGEFGELSKSTLGLMLSLSSLFCDQLIDSDARQSNLSQRWAHGAVDFTLPPMRALPATIQDQLVTTYTELFWLRSPDASERQLIADYFNLQVTAAGTKPEETKTILGSICVLVATSFQGVVVE